MEGIYDGVFIEGVRVGDELLLRAGEQSIVVKERSNQSPAGVMLVNDQRRVCVAPGTFLRLIRRTEWTDQECRQGDCSHPKSLGGCLVARMRHPEPPRECRS